MLRKLLLLKPKAQICCSNKVSDLAGLFLAGQWQCFSPYHCNKAAYCQSYAREKPLQWKTLDEKDAIFILSIPGVRDNPVLI